VAAAVATAVGLDGTPAGVLVLQSAMPAAVFTSLVALEHGLEADLVTSIVVVTTLVSLVTLPVVIALVL
jgi:malate permease and related proteins